MSNMVVRLIWLVVLLGSFPALSVADENTESSPVVSEAQSQQKDLSRLEDSEQQSASVIQSFDSDRSAKSALVAIEDQTKRLVMFFMGVPLLIFLIATAALGVAMGVYGKPVFVAHMVCAGLSLTLALGHAVVGIVWFYPF
ncbi:MAG: hypothetical protein RRB22_06385 [Gammaproteobacteria bacterium]|nr:hypothetical protein [Gammaproteobacteria bacterium]